MGSEQAASGMNWNCRMRRRESHVAKLGPWVNPCTIAGKRAVGDHRFLSLRTLHSLQKNFAQRSENATQPIYGPIKFIGERDEISNERHRSQNHQPFAHETHPKELHYGLNAPLAPFIWSGDQNRAKSKTNRKLKPNKFVEIVD